MIHISTPARICLFGEHQDYLGLPVIAMAIPLRLHLRASPNQDHLIKISSPLFLNTIILPLSEQRLDRYDRQYSEEELFFRSGLTVCMEEGLQFKHGFNVDISSQIPPKAGMSSSSALMVSWIHLLSCISDTPPRWTKKEIATHAYYSEVVKQKKSGGMMDQVSVSIGRLHYIQFEPKFLTERLTQNIHGLIIVDSGEQKLTESILYRCKNSRMSLLAKIRRERDTLSLHALTLNDIRSISHLFSREEQLLLSKTLENRDILQKGLKLFRHFCNTKDHKETLANLLNSQHEILRDTLRISTPKIEHLINIAMKEGAIGAKINGSGGGGGVILYAPDYTEKVIKAMKNQGVEAHLVFSEQGTRKES